MASLRFFPGRTVAVLTALGLAVSLSPTSASALPTSRVSADGVLQFPSLSAHLHGMGLRQSALHVSAYQVRAAKIGDTALPASVDLTANAVTPGDQGQVGSCASWAIGYSIMGWYSSAQHHAGAPFAPMYLYSQVNDGVDGGSYTSDNLRVLESQGIAERRVYSQGDYDWRDRPTPAEVANAALHKTGSHSYLFVGQNQGKIAENAIKAALAAGKPIYLAMPVYTPFFYLNSSDSVMTLAKATGSMLGGHAIAAFGYTPTGLLIENSWGTGWGNRGWATLAWDFVDKYVWEASTTSGFVSTGVAPTVSSVAANKVSTAGGTRVTITGTGFSGVNVNDPAAVTLTSSDDPTVTVNAPIVSAGSTSMIVTVPPAPTKNGRVIAGLYQVAVSNGSGTSVDPGSANDLLYVQPYSVTAVTTTVAASSGGTVTLTGSGFGASKTVLTANQVTGTVNGQQAAVTWISDTSITISAPPGVPGTGLSVVVSHLGLPGPATATAKYVANIASASPAGDGGAGARLLSVSGRGFANSGNWRLVRPDQADGASLPVLTSFDGTAAANGGVVLSSDTLAVVKVPAAPGGPAGTYRLAFDPDQTTYPGATFGASPGAIVVYGGPVVTKVSLAKTSTAGGATLAVTTTGAAALDSSNPHAVQLVSTTDPSQAADATVTAHDTTTITVTVPAAPVTGGTPLAGVYRVVVTTPLGASADNGRLDKVTYIAPFNATAAPGAKAAATGGTVLRVLGSGFGTSNDQFRSNLISVLVEGKPTNATWLSNTALAVALPAGVPGQSAHIQLVHDTIPGAVLTVPFVAVITGLSAGGTSAAVIAAGPSVGGTVVTVVGKGFAGASAWRLVDSTGAGAATLNRVTTQDALTSATSGVLVVDDAHALVKMPPAPGGTEGVFSLTFAPDQTLYPGASTGVTGRAAFTYAELGW